MPTRQRRLEEEARRRERLRIPTHEEETQPMPELYWCRWPSGFTYNGMPLDQGQVFALGECRNDDQLIRLRYIMPVEGKPRLATCGVCGAQFMDDARRDGHGRKRHSGPVIVAPSGTPVGAGLAAEDRGNLAEDRANEAALRGDV